MQHTSGIQPIFLLSLLLKALRDKLQTRLCTRVEKAPPTSACELVCCVTSRWSCEELMQRNMDNMGMQQILNLVTLVGI